jgi:hypothetical protein
MIPGATLPKSVVSIGGRFGYTDQGQTPNTQLAVFDYGETLLVFEVRGLRTPRNVGNRQVFDKHASVEPLEWTSHEGVKSPTAARGPGGIFHNFIHAVRTRNTEDLDAHILEGHYSSALCHLANISFRLGTDAPFNKKSQALGDDKEVVEMLARLQDHLKDNGVKLDETTYRVGRKLEFDAANERFVNDDEANALLTRPARPPFVVPEQVA